MNSIAVTRRGTPQVATGSDDCTVLLWDLRYRNSTNKFNHNYQVTTVTFNDDSTQLFTGGIDNDIKCWDIRMNKLLYALQGHRDTITSISLSPDGNFVASNAMDHSVMVWDVRAYVSGGNRFVNVYTGATVSSDRSCLDSSN